MEAQDFFDGTFRMDYEGQDPDSDASLYFLQTAGYGAAPLVFHTREGPLIRPANQMHGYDQGSVPARLQGVVSPSNWGRAYACHDLAYMSHGWWELVDGVWTFKLQTRCAVDDMLVRWMVATGCSECEAYEAHAGVYLGGGSDWDGHTGPFPAGPFTA